MLSAPGNGSSRSWTDWSSDNPGSTGGAGCNERGVITLRVEGSIDQLLRRAVRQIEAFGFDVYSVVDHSGDAAEAGLTIPEAKLVLFGHPKAVTELIVRHPQFALELPFELPTTSPTDTR